MTESDFYSKYNGVNGRPCSGTRYPRFKPSCINEAKFADELRLKEVHVDFYEGQNGIEDTIVIDWMSQEWSENGVIDLVEEIRRCFKHIGFIGNIKLKVYDRDGEGEAYREFEVVSK